MKSWDAQPPGYDEAMGFLVVRHTYLAYLYFIFGVHIHIGQLCTLSFYLLTHLFGFTLLTHNNTCLAYLYFIIYILLLAYTSWLIYIFTTHASLIYILLLACTYILLTHLFIWFYSFVGAQHMLGSFIFYFWRAHTYD